MKMKNCLALCLALALVLALVPGMALAEGDENEITAPTAPDTAPTEPAVSEAAQAVIDQITALPSSEALDSADAIADFRAQVAAARAAYDTLTEEQQDIFRKLCDLQSETAADEMRAAYKAGFKDGVALMKEVQK